MKGTANGNRTHLDNPRLFSFFLFSFLFPFFVRIWSIMEFFLLSFLLVVLSNSFLVGDLILALTLMLVLAPDPAS